jgi:uncharacterized alpha-E superfamily protein
MLSRIAESLFWTGRYIERAEDTARILDVHIHHLLEEAAQDEASTCMTLLGAMGVTAPEHVDAAVVTEMLAFDEGNPSSIVSSLVAARANGRGISEVISSEMWEALNITYNALPKQVEHGRQMGAYGFFRFVRERAAIMAGLADSTMCKDDAWRFLILGRSLERADMLARLLSSQMAGDPDDTDWVVILRSCSGHEAFLRTYSREPDPESALEFLLLDRLFPRSIYCALVTAEDCLNQLDPRPDRTGTHNDARRRVAAARTSLELRHLDDLLGDLVGLLVSLQRAVTDATQATALRYFRQGAAVQWHLEEGGTNALDLPPGATELPATATDLPATTTEVAG